jgi:hypothetical protein
VTLDVGRGELREQLVVKAEDRSCVAQYRLAFRGQEQPTAFVDKDGLSGEFLQALQLKGNRGLGAAEPPRGLGDATGLDD